jgi:methionyl-tRNA formyltransferase
MRIVFVGTVEFSRHCVREVLENRGNVVAVLTLGREDASFHADYADLSDVALEYRIALYKIKNLNSPETIELIHSLQPDAIFVFGWSQLVSKAILDIPPRGCIGTHPALLPRNRGRHPLIWALLEGLEESGLTFFYLNEHGDSGDILWQKSFPISLYDDAGSLYDKIKMLATEAIRELLPQLENGTAPRVPQNDSEATYWRKRGQKDGEIVWEMPTMKIYNLIRALTRPYIGAHTYMAQKKMVIWRSRLPEGTVPVDASNVPPGTVFAQRQTELDVRTGDEYLTVVEYELIEEGEVTVGTRLGLLG